MNKMIITIMILSALLATNVLAVKGGPMVQASILRYEPAPAEQGNTIDVWVQLNNIGTSVDKVAIKFLPEYPFSLPSGENSEHDVGTLSATESKVVKFTVLIDANAPNGDKDIKFLYKYASNNWAQLKAPITIETHNAAIMIDKYEVTPEIISPGQVATVKMELRNAGKISMKNADISIDLQDGKFSTIGSGAKKRIEYIGAGETETITFKLASDTTTEIKVYSIPITLSYQDEKNKQYTDTAKISLVVNAHPELSISVDSTKFADKKSAGTTTIKVVNKGIVNLKYLTLKLANSEDYEILSTNNETYIGNLDSDDYETADFIIKPLVKEPKLKVLLEFKDPYNINFKQENTIPLRIITEAELGKSSFPTFTVVLAVLIIGAIIYWKYFYKKKR